MYSNKRKTPKWKSKYLFYIRHVTSHHNCFYYIYSVRTVYCQWVQWHILRSPGEAVVITIAEVVVDLAPATIHMRGSLSAWNNNLIGGKTELSVETDIFIESASTGINLTSTNCYRNTRMRAKRWLSQCGNHGAIGLARRVIKPP